MNHDGWMAAHDRRMIETSYVRPPEEESRAWQQWRDSIKPSTTTKARNALTQRFSSLVEEHFELSHSVGSRSRDEPLHRLIPFKEAFSPHLVRSILDHLGVREGKLLDPFVGAGTSLLVAAERGMAGVGVDVLPFAAFASNTLLKVCSVDWAKVKRQIARIEAADTIDIGSFPDFPIRDWAFTPAALAELTGLHHAISRCHAGIERDVLLLAFLCVVERCSQATKDGTSLRRRPQADGRRGRYQTRRTREQVRTAFLDCIAALEADSSHQRAAVPGSRAIVGDGRTLPKLLGVEQFSVSIFSPPYPNRYDYSANYQLELGFGFVRSRDELKALRRAQLRSHLEAPWPDARTIESDALDEFLAALLDAKRRGDETGRVFKMVAGYFEDMAVVLAGLSSCMRDGAPVAIVVGTQVFAGQELPTDLLVAEIAQSSGFAVKGLWIARKKGVAVQQRARFKAVPTSRETVLLLEN